MGTPRFLSLLALALLLPFSFASAADPQPSSYTQMEAAVQALEKKYGVDIVFLSDSANGVNKGQLAIANIKDGVMTTPFTVSFNDAFGVLGWRSAISVMETYLKTSPQVSRILGVPVPPEIRVAPFYSTTHSSYTMFGLPTDPAGAGRVIPIIRFNTANMPNIFVHEMAHAFVTTECEAYHLCEVLSQAVENRIAPVRLFARDLPNLMDATIVWDPTNPAHKKLDRPAFDAIVRAWLTEHDAYTGFDYTLGRLLGDAMMRNFRLGPADSLGPMTRAIDAAHAAKTPGDVAKALGFADYRALSDAMVRAYGAHIAAVRANPLATAQFNHLVRESQPAAQARPSITPSLTLSPPSIGVEGAYAPHSFPPVPAFMSIPFAPPIVSRPAIPAIPPVIHMGP